MIKEYELIIKLVQKLYIDVIKVNIHTVIKEKNFIYYNSLPCDYENFFWEDDDILEFLYTNDFFHKNFIKIIKKHKKIRFDGDETWVDVENIETILYKISLKKINTIVKVHIYNGKN